MTPTRQNEERRHVDRRLTDDDIEQVLTAVREILPQEKKFFNGEHKRNVGVIALIGAAVGITTLIQQFYLTPITKELEEVESRMTAIDHAVRQHHEASATTYVLKRDYDRDMTRVLNEVSEIKALIIQIDRDRRR